MGAQRILIVEDEPMIVLLLEDYLEILGKAVAGVADTVGSALQLVAQGGIDAAVLDVNLRSGEQSWPVADALADAGTPFLFASGGHGDAIVDRHRHRPVLVKPFTMEAIAQALNELAPA